MRFFAIAVGCLATYVAAQTGSSSGPNPFTLSGVAASANKATTLTWQPTAGKTVTLQLQWGAVTTADQGITIASGIPNDGTFVWTPTAAIPAQADYFIRITDDQDAAQVNFSPRFSISGVSGSASTAAATSTTAASTSSTSTSTTSTSSTSSTTLITTTSTTSSSSSASSSTAVTSTSSSSSSSTTAATTTTTTAASSTSTRAAATTTPPNTGAAGTVKVPVAMMGVALGAFALL